MSFKVGDLQKYNCTEVTKYGQAIYMPDEKGLVVMYCDHAEVIQSLESKIELLMKEKRVLLETIGWATTLDQVVKVCEEEGFFI